jgi:hypothetical protein
MKVRHKNVGREYTVRVVGFARTYRAGQLHRMRAVLKDTSGKTWWYAITAGQP